MLGPLKLSPAEQRAAADSLRSPLSSETFGDHRTMDGPPHSAVKVWGGCGVSGRCRGLARLASLASKRRSRTAEFRIESTSSRASQRLPRAGSARVVLDACVGVLVMALFSGNATAQFFEMHEVPSAGRVYGITAGPDGNVWFTDNFGKIGKMTSSGAVTMYEIPLQRSAPLGITQGPDGNLWFADGFDWIGRITMSGVITIFGPVSQGGSPRGIAAGPDGNLWFAEGGSNKVGRITTAGEITEFETPTAISRPDTIVAGPDGNMWFGESFGNKIGRITPAGVVTEFDIPTSGADPVFICAGPDGNLWFTEVYGNRIGRITPTGVITEFEIPTTIGFSDYGPGGIAAGPDGNLWFAEYSAMQIGVITTSGEITEFKIPGYHPPLFLCVGPDGAIWFTTESRHIGRFTMGARREPPKTLQPSRRTRTVGPRP